MYSSTDIAALLNITPQTVRSRSEEFAGHLSHVANPGQGRQRQYTDDDVRVMVLINDMNKVGARVNDIHDALKTGRRGELPDKTPGVLAISPNKQQLALAARVEELEDAVKLLTTENQQLRIDAALGRRDNEELKAAREEIARLNREIGRLEAGKGDE